MDPLRKFTPEMMKTMSTEEIRAFWVARQNALKAEGQAHYTELISVETGKVVARAGR